MIGELSKINIVWSAHFGREEIASTIFIAVSYTLKLVSQVKFMIKSKNSYISSYKPLRLEAYLIANSRSSIAWALAYEKKKTFRIISLICKFLPSNLLNQ